MRSTSGSPAAAQISSTARPGRSSVSTGKPRKKSICLSAFISWRAVSPPLRPTRRDGRQRGQRTRNSYTDTSRGTGAAWREIFCQKRGVFRSGKRTLREICGNQNGADGECFAVAFVPFFRFRVTSTGHGALRTTRSAVLPSKRCFSPLCPRVERAIRSASISRAKRTISSKGRPPRMWQFSGRKVGTCLR